MTISKWMWNPQAPGHRWDDRSWVNRVQVGTGEDGHGSVDTAPNTALGVSLATPAKLHDSYLSALGTIETGELTPGVQLDFVYGINTQTGVATTANSASVNTNAGRLRLQSGTNSAGSAIFNSRRTAKYRAGQGMMLRFTAVFAAGTASNTQIVGAGSSADGYFFGYNGTSFGILHRNSGSDTWVAQTAWNGDVCDGTGVSRFNWNKQFGNVMMIKYPYLGYGDIDFYVLDPLNGWVLCHTIRYPNTTVSTQLSNPSVFFYAQNLNAGATTNLALYVGSVGMFVSGARSYLSSPHWAYDNNKTGVTAETVIFSLRNATTYNGVTNRSLVRLQSLSLGGESASQTVVARLRIGATVGGSPSFATINGTTGDGGVTVTSGNSAVSADTAGTTSTGGNLIWNTCLATPGNVAIDLTPFDLFVAPGEILTVGGFSTTSASRISATLNWAEDV